MTLKSLGINMLGSILLSWIGMKALKRKPLVVLYHGVTNQKKINGIQNYRGKHVSVEAFEKQIAWLSKHFVIVPLKEIEELVANNKKPNKPFCAITFDDGYRNNYLNAYPILKKYNAPATIFLTTDFIEKKIALWPDCLEGALSSFNDKLLTLNWSTGEEKTYVIETREQKIKTDTEIRQQLKKVSSDERTAVITSLLKKATLTFENIFQYPDYTPLSWEDIQKMVASGLITFGAHTATHPILSRELPETQKTEISLSAAVLHSTIGSCEHFAYPNGQEGDWNKATEDILKELKIDHAWTTEGRRVDIEKDTDLRLPRITLDDTELFSRFRALVSGNIYFFKSLLK